VLQLTQNIFSSCKTFAPDAKALIKIFLCLEEAGARWPLNLNGAFQTKKLSLFSVFKEYFPAQIKTN
jgi:hypothetical protein